jgi:hypothetical protein
MHSVNILFTKFTFLFTIQIPPAEKYQSRFAESNWKGYKNNKCLTRGQSICYLTNQKKMKKVIYALILPLVVVSGLVFANRAIKTETSPKPLSIADRKAHRDDKKKWEASPDGIAGTKMGGSPLQVKKRMPVLIK